MANMSKNLIGLKQYVVDSLAVIHRKVMNLEGSGWVGQSGVPEVGISNLALDRLKDRLTELEEKARMYSRALSRNESMESLEGDVMALQRRMDQREHEGKDINRRADEEVPFGNREMRERMARIKRVVDDFDDSEDGAGNGLQAQLNLLSVRVDKTEVKGSDEAFELGQFTFGSFAEFAKMLLLDEKVPTRGNFWDLFSVLVSMRPKGLSGKERADEQHSSERIKTAIFENNLLASMSHTRPTCLYYSPL
jgi:hypothetical protein